MGTKIFGPANTNPALSQQNTDLVVNPDGSVNTKITGPVDQGAPSDDASAWPVKVVAGNVTLNADQISLGDVTIKDATTSDHLKINPDGSIQATVTGTTSSAAEGTVGQTANTTVYKLGAVDGSGLVQYLQVNGAGRLMVDAPPIIVDVNSEGTPGTVAPGYALQMGGKGPNGTLRAIKTADDGTVQIGGAVSVTGNTTVQGTVSATQGTPAAIANSWPMKLTDGTDTANINPDGSLNVNVTGGTITTVVNENSNQGAPNSSLTNGWPVKITDGNVVLGTTANPLAITSGGTLTVAGSTTATQGAPQGDLTKSWPMKLTDGSRTLGVNADGSLNVAITAGTITANNSQGSPNTVGNGWPVKLTDGVNVIGTAAAPVIAQIGDGTRTAQVNSASSGLNVHVVGGSLTGNNAQGAPTSNANGWPVKLTDGIDVLGTTAKPVAAKLSDGVDSLGINTDGSINVKVTGGTLTASNNQGSPNSNTNAWPMKITDGVDSLNINANGTLDVNVVSGSISASNSQGAPATNANGWPVKITDGTNVLGTTATPMVTKVSDGSDVLAVNADGSVNVAVISGTITTNNDQGAPQADLSNSWPVKLTDGSNVLGTAGTPLPVSIAAQLPSGTNTIGKTIGYSHFTAAPVTGQKSVGAATVELFAGSAALVGRRSMAIRAVGDIYIGGAGVTTTNGWIIKAGEVAEFEFDPNATAAIFAVAITATTAYVMEVK